MYTAPLKDMRFTLEHVVEYHTLLGLDPFRECGWDVVDAVLSESGKIASEVLAPLNQSGDREGSRLENGTVVTPKGFAQAYRKYAEGGWSGIAADPAFGGQGLPHTLGTACLEMVHAANMGFGVCPLLTGGAIEALSAHGTDEQKRRYLPKLTSGAWTGTMNLTEPQAGSDVGALRTRAEPQADGSYRIFGTKIFISYGDHDMTENILHLVLARLPDAPPGTRGISLFLVPKILLNEDGSLGAHNDLKAVGVEHKLGIHASPTCVMAYGENEGAVGYLVGAENKGMACMFTMMNAARLAVGLQGVAIAERTYQQACAFAQDRKQGKPFGLQHTMRESIVIMQHADVRRMLMTMKAQIEACRAICYANAVAIDLARHHSEPAARADAKDREELLTPISKGFSTDMGMEVTSLGIQIHGGMGYVEETGVAQHFRDARIAPIYEGTNGIQAIDLATRKLSLNGGRAVDAMLADIEETRSALSTSPDGALVDMGGRLGNALGELRHAIDRLRTRLDGHPQDCLAAAVPFLRMFGLVVGAHYLARGALAAARHLEADAGDADYLLARIEMAHFYCETLLPQVSGLMAAVAFDSDKLFSLSPAQFASA